MVARPEWRITRALAADHIGHRTERFAGDVDIVHAKEPARQRIAGRRRTEPLESLGAVGIVPWHCIG